VLIRSVGQGCTRRRKQAPRATRRIGTMVNVSEKCYKRSIFISLQSLHAGVDARAPRTACGHRRPRTQDGMRAWTPAHPGRYAGVDARAPRTVCRHRRPRTQDARGSIILHIAIKKSVSIRYIHAHPCSIPIRADPLHPCSSVFYSDPLHPCSSVFYSDPCAIPTSRRLPAPRAPDRA
jgi:hypothetical protein